ncbi:somatostatin-2-like [Denticeps clupeoides]|uniref:Somatostatin/Cortistatin C-terminal domain-containing protein n=1 Tax=Denticeps clupeoides TaxID=299321 RepID=A0AAY4C6N9_9TELE|nr:somatostatin-2-like [Denticeps clupeoides]
MRVFLHHQGTWSAPSPFKKGCGTGRKADLPRATGVTMKFCGIHVSLTLLSLSLVLRCHSAPSQPNLDLRYQRLLQRERTGGLDTQEWNKRAVEHLLSQLSLPDADGLESDTTALGDQEDVRVELQRSLDSDSLAPRERKSNCFHWKGFTC